VIRLLCNLAQGWFNINNISSCIQKSETICENILHFLSFVLFLTAALELAWTPHFRAKPHDPFYPGILRMFQRASSVKSDLLYKQFKKQTNKTHLHIWLVTWNECIISSTFYITDFHIVWSQLLNKQVFNHTFPE